MVRAKFKCVHKSLEAENGTSLELLAVSVGSKENESFFRWTPSGSIDLYTVNPEAASQFELGKEYYVDFTPASE